MNAVPMSQYSKAGNQKATVAEVQAIATAQAARAIMVARFAVGLAGLAVVLAGMALAVVIVK